MSTKAPYTDQEAQQRVSTGLNANDVTLRYSPSDRLEQFLQVYQDSRTHPGTDSNQQINS